MVTPKLVLDVLEREQRFIEFVESKDSAELVRSRHRIQDFARLLGLPHGISETVYKNITNEKISRECLKL